jgi:hypothetical protein
MSYWAEFGLAKALVVALLTVLLRHRTDRAQGAQHDGG